MKGRRSCLILPALDCAKKHLTAAMLLNDALNQSSTTDPSEAETRAIIRYGLEINDPWLADLVRCVDAGESVVDNLYVHSSEEKIEALTDLICRAGDEPSAALLVLLSTLENSSHPKALANTAKHLTFTRCGELNVHGIVDAQIAIFGREVLAGNTRW
jgi:hypothetical protein